MMRQDDTLKLIRTPDVDVQLDVVDQNGNIKVTVREGNILSLTPCDFSGRPIGKRIDVRDKKSASVTSKWSFKSRIYFLVETVAFGKVFVAERFLPLEGAKNFRDLGGYRTKSGQHVRWNAIFRSAALNRLTAKDGSYLQTQVGIRTVCDFRGLSERETSPNITDWMTPNAKTLLLSIEADTGKSLSAAAMTGGLGDFYINLVDTRATDIIKPFLEQLLDAKKLPFVYHCTAGKDRTGVASAILLGLLGVPDTTIVADFSLTNVATPTLVAEMEKNPKYAPLLKSNRAAMMKLLVADPAWMEQTLAHINKQYGGIEAYVKNVVGLTIGQINQLRGSLLQ
jgi:protein-tyrosine phosphatase